MRTWAVTLGCLALVALVPGGQAQPCPLEESGTAGPSEHRFDPLILNETQTAPLWYELGDDAPPVRFAEVTFELLDAAPAFRVIIDEPTNGGSGTNWTSTARVTLTQVVNSTIYPMRIKASLKCGEDSIDERTITMAVPVAYREDFRALPKEVLQRTGQNSKVVFPVELRNLGNAVVRVTSELNLTQGPELAATRPPEVVLEPGRRLIVAVVFLTPAENGNADYTSKYNVIFEARPDPSNVSAEGFSSRFVGVELAVQVTGFYVPSLGVLPWFVGLVAAGWNLRRHRL